MFTSRFNQGSRLLLVHGRIFRLSQPYILIRGIQQIQSRVQISI
ncbi:hypothetical protein [Brasilonema bromeliae]